MALTRALSRPGNAFRERCRANGESATAVRTAIVDLLIGLRDSLDNFGSDASRARVLGVRQEVLRLVESSHQTVEHWFVVTQACTDSEDLDSHLEHYLDDFVRIAGERKQLLEEIFGSDPGSEKVAAIAIGETLFGDDLIQRWLERQRGSAEP